MEIKKKLKFFLKNHGTFLNMALLFMLVLGLQTIFSSTCYALTPSNDFTVDLANSLIDKTIENSVYFYDSTKRTQINTVMSGFKNNVLIQNFVNSWNASVNTSFFPYLENMTFYISPYSSAYLYIYVLQNNNEIGNDLPFIKTSESDYGSWFVYYTTFCDENGNSLNASYFTIRINANGTYTFSSISSTSSLNLGNYYPGIIINSSSDSAFYPLFYNFGKRQPFFTYTNSLNGYYWLINTNNIPLISPEPEQPSGDTSGDIGSGTITNSSGEVTGNIDLSGIESGIGQINNNLENIENKIPSSGDIANIVSGEVGKITDTLTSQPNLSGTVITSGDIEDSLNFDFMADPYENFWLSMTTGLSGALTNTVRQIPINWLGYQGVFDLDALGFNYPTSLKNILTAISTVSMVWLLVKWWKIIVDKLTSGDIDEVLQMNEEEGIVDLF